MEKEHFIYIRTHTPFLDQISVFVFSVAQEQGTFEDQDLIIIEVKEYLH